MKKFISLFMLATFFSLHGWAVTPLSGENAEKSPFCVEQINSKQDLVCADFDLTCGSGFACANSKQELDELIVAIYLQFCVYGDNPPCDPPTNYTLVQKYSLLS